ncbi:diadenylate cyclase CdaA [bacterium]|nr:diadenylate cyclase CdaA [bacterium]
MELFRIGFINVTLFDLIDIIIVAILFYQLIRILRGTRALQMLIGLGIILVMTFLATWLKMGTLHWLVGKLATAWVIVFLIVFQPELRNWLARLGANPLFSRFLPIKETETVNKVVDAVKYLSSRNIGGLVVIERDIGLGSYIQTGTVLNAELTPELIMSLFYPNSPLHDGAVIIQGERIAAAGCTLPLTENPKYEKTYGMRHRAAVGLTEHTDSIAIVVSEETGQVSISIQGYLRKNMSTSALERLLQLLLKQHPREQEG